MNYLIWPMLEIVFASNIDKLLDDLFLMVLMVLEIVHEQLSLELVPGRRQVVSL